MIFKNLDRIVFIGDSVTDAGSANPVSEGSNNLGTGYVRVIDNWLTAYYPEITLKIYNSGINGHTSRSLVNRFDTDVISLKPDYVSICVGINDAWQHFDSRFLPDKVVTLNEYEKNLTQMIEKSIKIAKKVFIMSPYYMEPFKDDQVRSLMDKYTEVSKKLAEKYGCEFINLQEMFDDFFKFRHPTAIAGDRVHPNQIGATLIAREFLKRCGFDPEHIPQ